MLVVLHNPTSRGWGNLFYAEDTFATKNNIFYGDSNQLIFIYLRKTPLDSTSMRLDSQRRIRIYTWVISVLLHPQQLRKTFNIRVSMGILCG